MMKRYLIACSLLALLVCSAFPVIAATPEPGIRLPTSYVTMRATDGIDSWFDMNLSNVPSGFDITNGTYQGWCVQKSIRMTRGVNHTVNLYSSYDSSLPKVFQNGNWDKINYILNHKRGSRDSIQKAIWCYTNNENCSSDANAQAMVDDAEQNGSDFIPQSGELYAIPIEGVKTIQLTFLELTITTLGDVGGLIWYDSNGNGLQEGGEPGIQNVMIRLYQSNDSFENSTTTYRNGYYSFPDILTAEYYLHFTLPPGYQFSPQDMGSDDTLDSDANLTTGKTIVFTVQADERNSTWDAGMFIPSSGSSQPGSPPNHPPTADGTAGEPYHGITHAEITFDGSQSYDRDGRIISWRWSFGDGTKGSGEIVKHSYALLGNYTVVLTVTDNKFSSDNYSTTAMILLGNNPPATPTVSGPTFGHMNVSYLYTVVSTDPDEDSLQYIFDWGDGSQSTSPLSPSGHSIQPMHQWNETGFYTVRVYAHDPSNATSESSEMRVAIDVLYVQNLGYLINVDGIGPFDMFFSNKTRNITRVQVDSNGVYSVDSNGTGTFNYLYDTQSATLSIYPEQLRPQYTMLLVGMGVVILFILLISFFGRRKIRKK